MAHIYWDNGRPARWEEDGHLYSNGQDARCPSVDGLTGEKQSGEEPWVEHLKSFVDEGSAFFSLSIRDFRYW